jgi:molybdate transport system substrate-binding protein
VAQPSVDFVGPLPAAIQSYTLFSAGIVAASKQADAARALVRFLSSPTSVAFLKARGFE